MFRVAIPHRLQRWRIDSRALCATVMLSAIVAGSSRDLWAQASDAVATDPRVPVVTKVEPPSWWINLTQEVMVLLSGRGLEVTHVECNLPSVLVERTQSAAEGSYLFLWLKIGAVTKSGTAVCRLNTRSGEVSFELPLAARPARLGRNQGITPADAIYLIMPDRFADGDPTNDDREDAAGKNPRAIPSAYHGGDLRGIREHLSYLKDLGVTTLWLTPIVKNGAPQDYHGYGAVDMYAVEPHLGTLREYQQLVAEAHQQGLKVLFDFVANHVGPKHPWVTNPPARDWFHGTKDSHYSSSASAATRDFYGEGGNKSVTNDPFELLVDPHAPAGLSRTLTDGWFFNVLPDLNTENPLVAEYLLQNAIWWAEASGLDGYRLDTFPYVARMFWAQWHGGLRQIYPSLTTIGEVFHPDPSVTSFFAGGQKRLDGIDSGVSTVFDYPLYFSIRDVLLRGTPAGRIADVLRHDSLYPHPELLVNFFGNHDVARLAGADGSTAAAERLAFALILTLRGIPQLYYGDEIGMPGGSDPDNRRDFPGGWLGDAKNAFRADGRTAEQQELFADVQKLLRLRREHAALQNGRLWHLASDDSCYIFLRETEEERLLVAFNNSAKARNLRVRLSETPAQGASSLALLFGEAKAEIAKGEAQIEMAARSISFFQLN